MPRPPKYVSRSDLGWGTSPADYANPRSGLVIHYDSADQNLAGKDHSACLSYWRSTRSFHTGPQRGWADIGYSFMACPHGYVIEGRGLFRAQAAQPGGNTSHYSCTLATGPNDTITPEQINAVRQLRQWLMEPESSIAGTVLGHRDFIPTSCPGEKAYRLVQDGTFAKAPTITDPDQGDSDMPTRDRFTWAGREPRALVKDEWVQMSYGARNGSTDGGPYFTFAGLPVGGQDRAMLYDISAGWRIEGLEPGAEYQTRLALYDPPTKAGESWTLSTGLRLQEHVHVLGDAFGVHTDKGRCDAKRRVRLEIKILTDSPNAKVIGGSCDTFTWIE